MKENRYDVENLRFELLENGRKTCFVYHNGELLHEEGRDFVNSFLPNLFFTALTIWRYNKLDKTKFTKGALNGRKGNKRNNPKEKRKHQD